MINTEVTIVEIDGEKPTAIKLVSSRVFDGLHSAGEANGDVQIFTVEQPFVKGGPEHLIGTFKLSDLEVGIKSLE